MPDDFFLYVLMRKDMASLDHTGKLIAQGCHAANHAAESIASNQFGMQAMQDFSAWQKQTPQGFGTTIVLGGVQGGYGRPNIGLAMAAIKALVDAALALNIPAAVITDPGYPLQDGATAHSFPCETCGWVFGSREKLAPLMSRYVLHPASPAWPNEVA